MVTAEVSIDAAIICDDTRREINNKVLLIGVWPLELVVSAFPASLSFVLHVEGAVLKSGDVAPRLWVRDDNEGVLFDSDLLEKLEPGEFITGRFSIDFEISFQVSRGCKLSFVMSLGAKEYVVARRRIEMVDIYRREREKELKLRKTSDKSNES